MKYLETIAYNNITPGTRVETFFNIRHKSYLIQYISTQEEIIERTIFGYILEDDVDISELYINLTKKYKRAHIKARHKPVEINSKLYEAEIKLVKEDFTYIGYNKEINTGFLGIIYVYDSGRLHVIFFNEDEKESAEMLVKRVKYKRKD
jgi:hypothetical protein